MPGSVTFTKDGSIATIVIEHAGRLNALSMPMWLQLGEAFKAVSADETLRCVIVRGAGDAFAAGADIAEFENERYDVESAKKYGKAIHPSLEAVSNCPHPVIAQIKGPCVGGGLEIAARADMRICSANACFGIPVNKLGLVVAYDEMKPLLDIVGPAAALEILLEGKIIDAARAEKIGLVNRVVADSDLETEVRATAKRIAEGAPLAARWHKQFVRRLLEPKALTDAERNESYLCFGTEDFKTGYRAFLDKAKPVFKGR